MHCDILQSTHDAAEPKCTNKHNREQSGGGGGEGGG